MALFMAHPPMPNTMTYMQKFSPKRRVAMGFIWSFAIYVLWFFRQGVKSCLEQAERGRGIISEP